MNSETDVQAHRNCNTLTGDAAADALRPLTAGKRYERGLAYQVTSKTFALPAPSDNELVIDESRMYVHPRIISTSSQDREGDSLIASGCNLDNYRRNPVVYWEHSHIRGELPIGRAETPEGRFDVAISGERILSGASFSQRSKMAAQVFHLLVERTIRASSIHFNPFETKAVTPRTDTWTDTTIRRGFLVTRWELLEQSFVGIPANPEAIGKALADNTIDGERICKSLYRSLKRWAPKRPVQSPGWTTAESVEPPPLLRERAPMLVRKRQRPSQSKSHTSADEEKRLQRLWAELAFVKREAKRNGLLKEKTAS